MRIYFNSLLGFISLMWMLGEPVLAGTKLPIYPLKVADNSRSIPVPYPLPSNNSSVGLSYYNQGNNFLQQGNYPAAIEAYTQALQVAPNLGNAYLGRGLAKRRAGDYEGAVNDYNQALLVQPNNALAYHNRAVVKAILGQHREALIDYTQAILINPNDGKSYINRARSRTAVGDKLGAISDYEEALNRDKNNSFVLYSRGVMLFEVGKYKGALESYNQALTINQNWDNISMAEVYRSRGEIHIKLGNFNQAQLDLNKAAQLYQQQGNKEAYQEVINELNKLK